MKKVSLMLILAATILVITGCASKTDTQSAPQTVSKSLIAEGQLFPVNYLDQAFTISGYVDKVLTSNNEMVKEGQLLVQLIKSPEADLALARAKQELITAQQALDYLKSTAALNLASSQLVFNQAQDAYDNALGSSYDVGRPIGNENSIRAAELALEIAKSTLAKAIERVDELDNLDADDIALLTAKQAVVTAEKNIKTLSIQLSYLMRAPDNVESGLINSDLAVAKANLDLAAEDLKKAEENGGIDPDEMANAEARLESASAAVASAQAAVDAFSIKAKMDGQVIDLSVKPGERVTPEIRILSVADYSGWVVYTDNLTEYEVTGITEGQTVEVVLDALPDVKLTGEVTYINSRFEEKRGEITYTVTIRLTQTDPRMRWGMTASANFLP